MDVTRVGARDVRKLGRGMIKAAAGLMLAKEGVSSS